MDDPLLGFHPVTRRWFGERFGAPTGVQGLAWPRIAAGEHVLLTAPTGSGKTLAAFLWAIDRLLAGAWEAGALRVLYVSPLKALNNDIRRNLAEPLAGLAEVFAVEGIRPPEVRAQTRSGDTPSGARRRMLRRPPEILITTPESLNILLTGPAGRELFEGLRTVILDEVHAVAGTKRGTHLMTAVERVAGRAGSFQRIALSATVRPLEAVARWVGGEDAGLEAEASRPRPVAVVDAAEAKHYALAVMPLPRQEIPEAAAGDGAPVWAALAGELVERIRGNRSTLVFANSRRAVERIARLVNERAGEPLVYAHHGSLSREVREAVEERLKAGQLAGIVATSSLELGIDVGAVDEVVLVGAPPSITAAVQRVGRSGHRVGEVSRGVFYPTHPRDLLDAAVVAGGVLEGAVEPLHPPAAPLDVLAQVILSEVATREWPVEDLYRSLRAAAPYERLSRVHFDLVVEMLAGRYAGTRFSALQPRLALDRVTGTLRARPGLARLLYAAGGTIPDRGLFALRLEGQGGAGGARLGQLDEEFVWERSVGDLFTLGVQSWRIQRITERDVFVTPGPGRGARGMTPFWRGEERDRSHGFAERVAALLERIDGRLEESSLADDLAAELPLVPEAARELVAFLRSQRAATGCPLPHRRHLVCEWTEGSGEAPALILHTLWGGRVNRPLGVALGAAWRERYGSDLPVAQDDDCLVLHPPAPCTLEEVLGLVCPDSLDRLLRLGLEASGFFGARFRENAGRALLLPRAGFGRRTPLWLTRQRAKELLEAVRRFDDFPLLLETWRTCLEDEMEVDILRRLLADLASGDVPVSEVTTRAPSPFAAEVVWRRTNQLMYEGDEPPGTAGPSRLREDLLRQVTSTVEWRPRVPARVAESLTRKLKGLAPGYAPGDAGELLEWLKERLAVPGPEWQETLDAVGRDSGVSAPSLLASLSDRVAAVQPDGALEPLVCAVEALPRLRQGLGWPEVPALFSPALDGSPAAAEAAEALERLREASGEEEGANLEEVLAQWLRASGPVPVREIPGALGLSLPRVEEAIASLTEEGRVVTGELTEGTECIEACDAGNLARLLRLLRAEARPDLVALPLGALPLFLATHQGLGERRGPEGLRAALEGLFGYPAPVGAWEADLLPARVPDYRRQWLDDLLAVSDLTWFGCGERQLSFALAQERELFAGLGGEDRAGILPDDPGRYSLHDLVGRSGLDSAEASRELWDLVWRGGAAADGFEVVRRGMARRFRPEAVSAPGRSPGRRGQRLRGEFSRWRASRPFADTWHRLGPAPPAADPLEREEVNRDRVRILLDRYGVLFRELLSRELSALQWGSLVRTLQVMEFSGEVVTGRFFQGVPGLQFASPAAVERLRQGLEEERVYWASALDPAVPCGLGLGGLGLPARLAGTYLVYRGRTPVVIAEGGGRRLQVRVGPDDPRLQDYLGFLEVRLTRDSDPARSVDIREINGEPATASPYRRALEAVAHVVPGPGSLRLSRRY